MLSIGLQQSQKGACGHQLTKMGGAHVPLELVKCRACSGVVPEKGPTIGLGMHHELAREQAAYADLRDVVGF